MADPTLVVNVRIQRYDVFIGRPSKWGSPYTHLRGETLARYLVRTRAEAVEMYRDWIQTQPQLLAALHELKGKRLGCYCRDDGPCHGHILAELADAVP